MLGLGEPHNLGPLSYFSGGIGSRSLDKWKPFPLPPPPHTLDPEKPRWAQNQPSLLQSLLHSSVIVTFLKFLSTSISPLLWLML